MDIEEAMGLLGGLWAKVPVLDNKTRLALIRAKKALKKQIPKKPRENDAWAELTTEERLEDFQWHCRECHGHLEESWDHCAWCGQRLDWSGE